MAKRYSKLNRRKVADIKHKNVIYQQQSSCAAEYVFSMLPSWPSSSSSSLLPEGQGQSSQILLSEKKGLISSKVFFEF
jgi:hypothetical protein